MDNLFKAYRHLSRPRKIAITVMVLLSVLTWAAVCIVLASYLA